MLEAIIGSRSRTILLDIAPMRALATRLRSLKTVDHIGMDSDPGADGRIVNLKGSVTTIPLADRSVDVLLCYHVLEHVPDDRRAMKEIGRVLASDGVALIQVPRKVGVPTDEDPHLPVAERVARFGQADHVRYYGSDFEDRLAEAGLLVQTICPNDVLASDEQALIGVLPQDAVWLAMASTPHAKDDLGGLLRVLRSKIPLRLAVLLTDAGAVNADHTPTTLAGVVRRIEQLETQVESISAWVSRWDDRYRKVRFSPPARKIAELLEIRRRR